MALAGFAAPVAPKRTRRRATVLKCRAVEDKVEEAEASLAFLVAVRDNDREPVGLRLAAAREIMNRVLGKPVEMRVDGGEAAYREWRERVNKVLGIGKTDSQQ